MSTLLLHKVSVLPSVLEPSSAYFVNDPSTGALVIHITDVDGSIYIGNTMFDLRVAIERGETTVVKNHTGLIEMILDVLRGWGITETKTYRIDADFKKAIAI